MSQLTKPNDPKVCLVKQNFICIFDYTEIVSVQALLYVGAASSPGGKTRNVYVNFLAVNLKYNIVNIQMIDVFKAYKNVN